MTCAAGFPVTPHSHFHFFRLRVFSVYLLTSHTKSFDEFSEEIVVGVVEELVDQPGTTNGTYFNLLQSIFLLFFGELWFSTAGPMVSIPMIFAEFPERKNCVCLFKKHHRHE